MIDTIAGSNHIGWRFGQLFAALPDPEPQRADVLREVAHTRTRMCTLIGAMVRVT